MSTIATGRIADIVDGSGVRELAARVLDPLRHVPIIVCTIRRGELRPTIDAQVLRAELGDNADVLTLTTGDHGYELDDALDGHAVFGGAVRVYWPTRAQALSSRLFTVFPHDDPEHVLQTIIKEVQGWRRPATTRAVRGALQHSPFAELGALVLDAGLELSAAPKASQTSVAVDVAPRAVSAKPGPGVRVVTAEPVSADDVLAGLRAQLAAATRLVETRTAERDALQAELDAITAAPTPIARPMNPSPQLVNQVEMLEATLRDRDAELKRLRTAASVPPSGAEPVSPVLWDAFLSVDEAVRDAIYRAWVERIPATDRETYALPKHWAMSPGFAESLRAFNDKQMVKALRCCVDVLTGLATNLPSREVHDLRASDHGDAKPRIRHADGAVARRAYIEQKTASARRLHFWRCPDGTIELAQVGVHDNLRI